MLDANIPTLFFQPCLHGASQLLNCVVLFAWFSTSFSLMCVEVCDMNVHMLLLEPDCLMWVQHVNVTETQVCCLFVSLSGVTED